MQINDNVMIRISIPTTARVAKITKVNNNIPLAFELPWWRSTGGGTRSYLDEKRTKSYLEWAYGKMAYASAGGFDTVWGENNIPTTYQQKQIDVIDVDNLPDDPAIDPVTGRSTVQNVTKKVTTDTIYQKVAGDKFLPKAHLISISTSGIADTFGAVTKGSYTYRSYAGLITPPAVGSAMSMAWGWAYGGKVLDGESFSGTVIGYDISANSEGGFDVTVTGTGKNASVSVVGISADASIDISAINVTDAAGNTYAASDLFSAIGACSAEAVNLPPGPASFNNGIQGCVAEIPENYDKPDDKPTTDNPTPMPKKAYVKFDSIVMLANKILSKYCSGVQLLYGTPRDSAPFDASIYSANPLEVLLPPNTVYGDKDFTAGGGGAASNPIRLPNILIAADYVAKCGKSSITESTVGGTKERTLSLKSFFDNIFKVINENIGSPFSLTITNSGTKGDKNLYIADMNNVSNVGVKTIGTVRSANLSAKLDSDSQKMFFVKTRAPASVQANVGSGASSAPTTGGNDYSTTVASVGKKASDGNVNALKGLNKTKVQAVQAGASGYGTGAPWDLSLTLDGSSGWQYGGVIQYQQAATSALVGNGYKVYFAISDIQHSVSDGDWTVSLSTMCKILK